ncbi:hypothetical protein CASFOL_004903 [Castilleja foliolosa]|uniref:Beta-amylase n=1 Tax=Castilleja foliolosa TaxID=1961234 RepID=A0ABD3ECL1_9LAMI
MQRRPRSGGGGGAAVVGSPDLLAIHGVGPRNLRKLVEKGFEGVAQLKRCGGNVGDSCTIPLPKWAVEEIDKDPDLAYTNHCSPINYSRSIGILASEASKDGEIAQILDQFLQTLDFDSPHTLQTHALELNHQAKNIWENHRFIGVLLKTLLPCSMRRFNLVASRKLTEFIMRKIKSDPSFKDVFKYSEPDSLMRSALSIWIGYWSNDYMTFLLVDLMGRRALGLNYYVDVSEDVVNDEKTHLASGAFLAVEEDMIVCSPLIADLRQDESIKTLAKQLIENPVAVKLVEELLMSLQDDVPVGRDDHYKYHMRHKKAVFKFWCDPLIVLQLSKALKESVHLVNIYKKCSKRAQFLRCAERFTRIQRDPLLVPILRGDPNHKMRGAVSILFGYCSEVDLSMLVCAIFGAQEENDAFSEYTQKMMHFR